MKVVINRCYGGFSISKEAAQLMASMGCRQAQAELDRSDDFWYGYGYAKGFDNGYSRIDEHLIYAVETLGVKANGCSAELVVVEIPDGIKWYIQDYDGMESIEEEHRSW